MASEPKEPFVCLTRYRDGNVIHHVFFKGKYWVTNQWELECMKQGIDPEELGMFSFTDAELNDE